MISGAHRLAGLHPQWRAYIEVLLRYYDAAGWEPLIPPDGGLRSWADQARIVRSNPAATRAGPGQSPHNYGLAVDITSRRGWESREAKQIHAVARSLGLTIGTWDLPHHQVPNWRQYVAARR